MDLPKIGAQIEGPGSVSRTLYRGTYLGPAPEREDEGRVQLASGLIKYVDMNQVTVIDEFPDLSARAKILRKAEDLITGDRNRSYGEPTQNFQDIADGWNTLLRHKLKDGSKIDPGDTAAMMVLVKLVRRIAGDSEDNWIDIAGYAGCGAQCDEEIGRTP